MTRLLIATLLCLQPAADAAAAGRYAVSYLWASRKDSVERYRDRVGGVLGPSMRRRLRVVRGEKLWGLVYDRKGDAPSTKRVSVLHSRLLRSKGLEAAAVIPSRGWGGGGPRPSERERFSERVTENLADLEKEIDRYIKRERKRGGIAADERTSWVVYDFETGDKLVDINEDKKMQAASMIKPLVALAFFHEVKHGRKTYGPKSRLNMRRMIQHSDNRATNYIIKRVGGPAAVQRILRSNYGSILADVRVVEYIPAGGRTYKNKASVHDYSRFLYALWHAEVPYASELKRLMALPGPDRLYTGAKAVPAGTKVYNKTGSTARLCGDMGILEIVGPRGRRRAYSIIGVIEKDRPARDYAAWIQSRGNVIREISSLVYTRMKERYAELAAR